VVKNVPSLYLSFSIRHVTTTTMSTSNSYTDPLIGGVAGETTGELASTAAHRGGSNSVIMAVPLRLAMVMVATLALAVFSAACCIFVLWSMGAGARGHVRIRHDLDVGGSDVSLNGHPALTRDNHYQPPFIFPAGDNIVLGSLTENDYTSVRAAIGVGVRINTATLNFPGFPGLVVVHTPVASVFALPVVSFVGFYVPSDVRAKTDIRTIDAAEALALIKALRPVTFVWTEEYRASVGMSSDEYAMRQAGFIAQELEQILPQAVTYSNFTLGGTVYNDWHDVKKDELIAYLVSAVQSLEQRVAALE
jgi:hypothetical protein